MIEEELRALIAGGEGQRAEFKAAEADAADLGRAIAALANSGGGTLLLGVGDDGTVIGLWYTQPAHVSRHIRTLPDLAAWRQFVVNVSRHNCEPAVPIGLERDALEGRDVLVVHVPDGQDKPYRANGRVYVRIDTTVHEATREDVARLMVGVPQPPEPVGGERRGNTRGRRAPDGRVGPGAVRATARARGGAGRAQ